MGFCFDKWMRQHPACPHCRCPVAEMQRAARMRAWQAFRWSIRRQTKEGLSDLRILKKAEINLVMICRNHKVSKQKIAFESVKSITKKTLVHSAWRKWRKLTAEARFLRKIIPNEEKINECKICK